MTDTKPGNHKYDTSAYGELPWPSRLVNTNEYDVIPKGQFDTLKAENERLRKAGDEMAKSLDISYIEKKRWPQRDGGVVININLHEYELDNQKLAHQKWERIKNE